MTLLDRSTIQRTMLLCFVAILFPLLAVQGADKKDAENEEPVIKVNPEGQPQGYDQAPKGPTYYLWREGDVWHLRTKTKKKARLFEETIRVKGGIVKKISNFGGLEARVKPKGKGPQDLGWLNDDKNEIRFKFKTAGREDGFDFQLNSKATELQLDLKLDGYEHRGNIIIGREGQGPPKGTFSIPIPAESDSDKEAKTN